MKHKMIILLLYAPLSQLAVSPIIPIESQPQSGWREWPNDPNDDCVIYMEQLIVDHFTFKKGMWPAGVTTEPLLKKPKDCGHRNGKVPTRVKQSLKPKKVIKKETSSRKRRISSYFTPSSVTSFTNAQLTEIVLGLQKQMKQMHKLLKKKKSHGRQTSFHTLLSRCKKPGTSDHVEKEAPIEQVNINSHTLILFYSRRPLHATKEFHMDFIFCFLGCSCHIPERC